MAYLYDRENRLTTVFDGKYRIEFTYDYMNRRVKQVIKDLQNGSSVVSTHLYVYHGYHMIAEYEDDGSTISTKRTYTWGPDISGSYGGAGGIGGLWLINDFDSGESYSPGYDHQGNIIFLYKIGTGTGANAGHIVAEYEYDPYGQLVRETGWAWDTGTSAWVEVSGDPTGNPFRYQTKWNVAEAYEIASHYNDRNMHLYDFGLRFYHPRLGRFINRDPIADAGGSNLYAYVGNDPVNKLDYIGLAEVSMVATPMMMDGVQATTSDGLPAWIDENGKIVGSLTPHSVQLPESDAQASAPDVPSPYTSLNDSYAIGGGLGISVRNNLLNGNRVAAVREMMGYQDTRGAEIHFKSSAQNEDTDYERRYAEAERQRRSDYLERTGQSTENFIKISRQHAGIFYQEARKAHPAYIATGVGILAAAPVVTAYAPSGALTVRSATMESVSALRSLQLVASRQAYNSSLSFANSGMIQLTGMSANNLAHLTTRSIIGLNVSGLFTGVGLSAIDAGNNGGWSDALHPYNPMNIFFFGVTVGEKVGGIIFNPGP